MKTRLLATVAAATLLPAAAEAALFQSAYISAYAEVVLGDANDSFQVTVSTLDVPLFPLSTGPVSATATVRTSTATATTAVEATWASSTQGSVTMDWGWDADIDSSLAPRSFFTSTPPHGEFTGRPRNWSYTFTAVADGQLTGTFILTSSDGNTFGLQAPYAVDDLPFGILPFNTSAAVGNFPFSVALTAGQTYTMAFMNNGNLSQFAAVAYDQNVSARAVMNWEIVYNQDVSEPATLALLGAGLLGLAALRRRKA